jgi:Protein of unknown function, DUF481
MNTQMTKLLATQLLLSTALFVSTSIAQGADKTCKTAVKCVSATEQTAIGANTEATVRQTAKKAIFAISVDGEKVAGTDAPTDHQRQTDVALEKVDIQVKFDGLDVKPALNVSTYPARRGYGPGERIDFLASSNYPDWIAKSELRISFGGKLFKAVPVTKLGTASWQMPAQGSDEYSYVLRVYDEQGRFDETAPLTLTRTARTAQHSPADAAVAPGFGEDRTAVRNIPVRGGAVTVYGRNVPEANEVSVFNSPVPVDGENSFVVQRILPPGDHTVDVAVRGTDQKGVSFNRDINIPSSEWFYVALADVTAGYNKGSKNIEAVSSGEFDKVYTKGRLAFYLKGKIKGQYLLTAAADSGEGPLKNLIKGLDGKTSRDFLRRIDPDNYYAVYGDDSTTVEDAPTRGKFYVRLERGDSHVMWGNYKTQISGSHFLRNERALYGASAVYKSDDATEFGERKTQARVYAAQPDTLPQRDVLRGTGGSAYFLKYHDITVGSETLAVEVRDRSTGRVISRQQLKFGEDYDIDYVQSVVILKKPLNSSTADGAIVRDGATGNHDVYLVAAYEYTPAVTNVKGYSIGARAEQWAGDHVRVGVTGATEKTGSANQELLGADLRLRKSDETYLDLEIAQSRGPGFGYSKTADGGLNFNDTATAGVSGRTAGAARVHGSVGLQEISNGALKGDLDFFYDKTEAGFSSLTAQATRDDEAWGASGKVDLNSHVSMAASYDEHRVAGGEFDRKIDLAATVGVTESTDVSFGGKVVRHMRNTGGETGSRVDIGARVEHHLDDDNTVYAFGQVTVDRSGGLKRNDRVGIGAKYKITEKVTLNSEVSYGTSKFGASAGFEYAPTADDVYYVGYRLDPTRADALNTASILNGRDLGAIVAGTRRKLDDQWSMFAEDSYDLFGRKRSLTQAYGVNYTPSTEWQVTAALENGTVWDNNFNSLIGLSGGDFDRKALSLATTYRPSEKVDAHVKGEVRYDNAEINANDLTAYFFAGGINYGLNDDWRFSSNLDVVISDASTTLRDGKYAEGSFGYAYRPTDNDRLNALFKYTFLYDKPGPDQVTVSGSTDGPSQVSHILTADASYDINQILTVGGKYGFRIGESRERASGSDWEKSSAHLGIVRADVHVVKSYDVLLEGRMLWDVENKTTDLGVLVAGYRQVNENLKVGVGYNFGKFSDDLRDLQANDHGIFINAVGQF